MVGGVAVIDRQGKVMIPGKIREALGLREGDRVEVTLELENGHARLAPSGSVVARTAGMLKGPGPVLSAEELRDSAELAIAEEALERSEP